MSLSAVAVRAASSGAAIRISRGVRRQRRTSDEGPSCNTRPPPPPPLAPPAMGAACQRSATTAAARGEAAAGAAGPPVLLLDVMDTIVYDPFFQDMPRFFNCTFKELLAAKHPTAWVQFERDEISEEQLFASFFADGRPVDGPALRAHMASCYRYLDGMEALLQRLAAAGVPCHACSNYPAWWRLIERKLRLSRYLAWTFLSCEGPMKGLRKPSPEAYAAALAHLGVPPSRLLFVDDRQANVDGALAAGIAAIRFESAAQLEAELRARGVPLG